MTKGEHKRDLSPVVVARRLEELRRIYMPMNAVEARQQMTDPTKRAAKANLSPEVVARRLAELRALMDLSAYLHSNKK